YNSLPVTRITFLKTLIFKEVLWVQLSKREEEK
ncbi:unnamed protein product, partial [marine sediment metagenome]